MAASVPLRGVTQKKGYQAEQESFEKTQTASIQKAINSQEVPVKEKHARNTILGSFHVQGGSMFWSAVSRLPLQGNPIVAWKFCHIFHKLMRDGHVNVIIDSQKYTTKISELGKLWGHLKDGYGKLIRNYCRLLVQKMAFHRKFITVPGNLVLTDDQLDELAGRDVNGYFEISANMFDYMDEILELATSVFNSMDMSRSNSMMSSGQCKLAPLVQCIMDSAALYDYLVKYLFKLHSAVPQDTLNGHRDRFLKAYKLLKQFYRNSKNLQYFKTLIQVPDLPDDPPNFLIATEINSHVKPVVTIPPEDDELDRTPEVEISNLVETEEAPAVPEKKFSDVFGSGDMGGFKFQNQHQQELQEKDRLIEQLMREIERLKQEILHIKSKAEDAIIKLKDKITDLEDELEQLRQQLNQKNKEKESLETQVMALQANEEARLKLEETEKHAKSADDKFKKMKDVYQKLREEHVALLRKHGELSKQFVTERKVLEEKDEKKKEIELTLVEMQREKLVLSETMQRSTDDSKTELSSMLDEKLKLENNKKEMEERLKVLGDDKSTIEVTVEQLKAEIVALQQQLKDFLSEKNASEDQLRKEATDLTSQMLTSTLEEGETIIKNSLEQLDNPTHATSTCTAEYLVELVEPVLNGLDELQSNASVFLDDKKVLTKLTKSIMQFSNGIGSCIVHGKATSNSAPIEQGEELSNACRISGDQGLELLGSIRKGSTIDVSALKATLQQIMIMAEGLVPKMEDVKVEEIGDLIDQEMHATSKAIDDASKKIQQMLESSRKQHSGVKLEVNERILDSCTELMMAIRILIEKSKELQREIIASGRGASTAKEFYKKHHRWTEGLISAAKAVGWGANVLVESADKVIRGEGKFEELVVCSQEIAASTTQLVVASKVKSDKKSEALKELSSASKKVTAATGNVVASAKTSASLIEEQDTLNFSKLTLHQAKRLEMDSRVRVIELESDLEKERVKLSELRKKHYQLAGESEEVKEDEEN